MKAAVLKEINKPIEFENFQLPIININWCEVEALYSAINHRDIWISKGMYAGIKVPIILGSDVCGLVENRLVIANPSIYWGSNEGCQQKKFQVLGLPEHGTFAQKVYVPVENIFEIPVHLTKIEAAALPLAGLTAFRALITKCKPIKGEKIFITGIGGGVALFVMQFALALELEVYVSSSDDKKIEKAISLGAKAGVNYSIPDWEMELKNISNGINICIDGAGGPQFNKILKIAEPGARICIYGGTQGTISDLQAQVIFWKQLSILGSTMGSPDDFRAMLDFVSTHKIIPIVDSVFPLSQINEAFFYIESKRQFGKIVLDNSK